MRILDNHKYVWLLGVLGWLILSLVLPQNPVQAADIQPTARPEPTICGTGRSISVNGSALINVTPDRALVQLGVQSNGTTVDAAEKANSQAIQRVIAAIRQQGVQAGDIATDLYVIDPIYEDYDSLYIKGYRVNNTVAVTIREVNKTSVIVSAALEAGANQVHDVSFYTSELRKYRDQARELAVTAAGEKASALAASAGAEIGCVQSINENSWSYYNGWWYGSNRNASLWTQNTIQNAPSTGDSSTGSSGDEPISLGQISIKAEVSISYALK
ncbi:MAG: SIMPL domain-containing protein [Leptolinea sp.]|jgi:uncharacterized protein YggE|nr:SIMPL domain-containing protein [Leptolinea sp.]